MCAERRWRRLKAEARVSIATWIDQHQKVASSPKLPDTRHKMYPGSSHPHIDLVFFAGTGDSAPAGATFGSMGSTLYDELGGEPVLRAIIDRFVDRVCDDTMIGFFFRKISRERLKEKEFEFAARHLGADLEYTGRPLEQAHARHPIMGGQFMRRLQILKETLADFDVPPHIVAHWVAHTESQRPLITRDSGGRCDPAAAGERVSELMRASREKDR